jgi:hypothetical protein
MSEILPETQPLSTQFRGYRQLNLIISLISGFVAGVGFWIYLIVTWGWLIGGVVGLMPALFVGAVAFMVPALTFFTGIAILIAVLVGA